MTDELRAEVSAAVTAIMRGRADTAPDDFDSPLWNNLVDAGFHLVGVPEAIGGSGGDVRDLAAVIDLAAYHTARTPVAESAFLAGWLLASASLPVPAGLVVAALDEADGRRCDGALCVSGRLRTPWARHADQVVTIVRSGQDRLIAVIPVDAASEVVRAANLAGEPRDTLMFDEVPARTVAPAPPGVDPVGLRRRGALARCVQLAGAARAVLDSTRRHVAQREQFGRPLSRFQAVQQQLAALAAEVTAVRISADAAMLAVAADESSGHESSMDAEFAIAAAKATASASAQVIAAIGHQLHGALGYSREHHLGAATARLWSWREEFGNESYWQDQLAVAVRGAGDWWPLVTGGTR